MTKLRRLSCSFHSSLFYNVRTGNEKVKRHEKCKKNICGNANKTYVRNKLAYALSSEIAWS